ncbi:MAG: class E sortase [Acidimicrobiia bacterium]
MSENSTPEGNDAAGEAKKVRSRSSGGFTAAAMGRPAVRKAISGLSILLAVVGIGMLAYPFATNLYQGRLQDQLADEIKEPELIKAYQAGTVEEGDPLTRIQIPALDVDVVVVEGTTSSALRAGAGHYPNTPLPGEEGNVAIAGHRTTYGKPFANIDRLEPGDEIILETPIGRHVYSIDRKPFVVSNTDWQVVSQSPGRTLTLTTCHPRGSAEKRLVIKAEHESGTAT